MNNDDDDEKKKKKRGRDDDDESERWVNEKVIEDSRGKRYNQKLVINEKVNSGNFESWNSEFLFKVLRRK